MGTFIEPSAALLLDLAALQHGVLTRAQATAHGFDRHAQQRMVRRGAWQRLTPGAVLTNNAEPGWMSLAWAGVLRAGDGARLGGAAAAYRHGLIDVAPDRIDILHTHGSRLRGWGPIALHQERPGVRRAATVGSPPRTTIEDTVLDLIGTDLGCSFRRDAIHWLTTAVQRRLTTAERIREALDDRRRLSGRDELITLLADVDSGVHSTLEFYYRRDVETAHGLPAGRRQARAESSGRRQWRDVYYDAYRLLVELDGQTGHVGVDRFRDYERDNAALIEGDATLRYGLHDVRTSTCQVARQVANLGDQRRLAGPPRTLRPMSTGLFG